MNCEAIRKELVAYRDGELPEQDRVRVATHLETCMACSREEAQLAEVEQLFASLERIAPSPDFAATFWRRLEQEGQVEQESRWARWWRESRERAGEWAKSWQVVPALAAAASLLVFLGYMSSGRSVAPPRPDPKQALPAVKERTVPAEVLEKPDLFTNYRILTNLDKLMHFDEIAAIDTTSPEQDTALAQGEDVPPPLLENPSFFVHYPILQKMERLQNLEAILDLPDDPDQEHRG